MSHITGTIVTIAPVMIGPDSGSPPSGANTWTYAFSPTAPPIGNVKFVILHFQNSSLPAHNHVEVELGYGNEKDVFTSADGSEFWTRPVNVAGLGGTVTIRYITDGAGTGSVVFDRYGRGERHSGDLDPSALSNCDPFLLDATYTEPIYDPFWFCHTPPNWENAACIVPDGDIRTTAARSVGIIIHVDETEYTTPAFPILSTCTVTLVGTDLVITAGHCMANPDEHAKSSSIIFGYQTDCDSSRPAGYSPRVVKVKRVVRQRYDSGFDYCLIQLDVPPGGLGISPLTMRTDLPAVGEQIFGLHHPNGAAKKLSIPHPGFETVITRDSMGINVDLDVSGGSSGSGLFDTAGRIVGVLANGYACDLSYFPTATILQQLVAPVTPPVTRDVMLVFDRSGSMSMDAGTGHTKIVEAQQAASLFIQLVRAGTGNRVGLVSFSTTPSMDFGLADVNSANKTTLIGPPLAGSKIGLLHPDGSTTIGGGLKTATMQLVPPGTNPRSILLMTDGLQNTPPMIEAPDVQGVLGGIDINAIGFGTEASLDGALLTELSEAHNGLYVRAGSGLDLKKYFALAFGNIFESGMLMDPEFVLDQDVRQARPITFQVCGEDTITIVVGWDNFDAMLRIEVTTPGHVNVAAGSPGVEAANEQTWTFMRIPLPHGGERDGVWSVTVFRPGGSGEFPPPAPAVRYFVNVVASGGPLLERMPDHKKYFTGDPINPMVMLRNPAGGTPRNATVKITVKRPNASLGNILARARLRQPIALGGDTIPARQATLLAVESETGRPAVEYAETTFELMNNPENTDAFEPNGLFGRKLKDLLTVEGSYTFHAVATYGTGCVAARELQWSLHVEPAVDPTRTEVTTTQTGTRPDGTTAGTITITPRDPYGNLVGPGRQEGLMVTGTPGTTVTGPIRDNGDGTYTVPVAWDPTVGGPGVIVGQPGRPPVVVGPPTAAPKSCKYCWLLVALLLLLVVLLLLLWLYQ